jgi:prepilin-type N-terminal cleavage/methylation domain-containing protein
MLATGFRFSSSIPTFMTQRPVSDPYATGGSASRLIPRFPRFFASGTFLRKTRDKGLTLVEVMIAVLIFGIMFAGVLSAITQTHRFAERNMAMAVARSVAQGIIEQARLEAAEIRRPTATTLPLRFIGNDVNNFAAISQRNIPIEAVPGVWTAVGALEDPTDPASAVLGVLLDAEQRDASNNIIRPAKYMDMEVNFRITANEDVRRYLTVELRYRWIPPVNQLSGSANWIEREVRTAIAYSSTF